MPTGSKSWIFCYSIKEGDKWRERKNGVGSFKQGRNDAGGLTVSAARRLAERIKNKVKHEGADSIEERKKESYQQSE